MKFKLIFLFLVFASCTQNIAKNAQIPFNSKGFAYIYNDNDFTNKIVKNKFNNNSLQIAHNKLRPNSLIKLLNPITNDYIILRNSRKIEYPVFYKILITEAVAKKINLEKDMPFVEVLEIKKNKSFIADETKIYNEEKKIHSKAPVELIKIDNISINKESLKKVKNNKIYIIIAEFYSKNSAITLKERIKNELTNFNHAKLIINSKKTNKSTLLSGPYTSVNLMKNDYIKLLQFGFEELDITINE